MMIPRERLLLKFSKALSIFTARMKRTAILLHGLGRTRFSMLMLASKLRARGFHTLTYGYPSLRYTIAEQSKNLRDFLLSKTSADDEINFVTHSLGSIIVRKCALEHHSNFKLRRAVMLGPPNQGSQTARIVGRVGLFANLLGPAFRELRELNLPPATDLLEVGILAGSTCWKAPFVSDHNDGIVAVNETRLEGARDLKIIEGGLHSFLMYYPEVIEQTIHFLENGVFHK